MIPKGKCKCFCADCNSEEPFYADRALYKIFEKGEIVLGKKEVTESNFISIADSYYSDIDDDMDDLSASADKAVENIDSGESSYHSESSEDFNNSDIFVSVDELVNSNGVVERCNGLVKIRFIPKKSSAPEVVDGHYLYREVTFGVTVGNEEETEITKRAHDRYCPVCKQNAGFGTSMGFKDYYMFLILGCTNSGKTTWLQSTYNKRGTEVAGWLLQKDVDYDYVTSYNNLKINEKTKSVGATQSQTNQTKLIFYHSLSKNISGNVEHSGRNNRNIGVVFRDIAGENFTFSESQSKDDDKAQRAKAQYAQEAQHFTAFSDGILVFRDVTSMPVICSMHSNPPDECNLEVSDYQSRIRELMDSKNLLPKQTAVDDHSENEALAASNQNDPEREIFKDYDISHALEYLHLPTDHKFSAMYVMNKTDMLRILISNPIFDNTGNPIYPFDFRCNVGNAARVLTGNSSIFSGVDHRAHFNLSNYLRTAAETAHFVSMVDSSLYNNFCRIIGNKNYNRGITAITARITGSDNNTALDMKRVLEPFAWLVESLINGEDFSGSLLEQYSSCISI